MLPILFQDEHLVAVDKPSGMLVHRTALDAHERAIALQLVRQQLGRRVYAVHRLDKGTSGVLLFALSRDVGQALSAMFAAREIDKTYLAIVRGHPPPAGEIDYPLARLDELESSPSSASPAREAITQYRRLATTELPHRVDRYPTSRYALMELVPLTGRSHQLRRHLKHISHPIIGDANYGKGAHNRLFATLFESRRLLLACVRLQFPHPVSGESLTISSPPAEDFTRVVEALGWSELLTQYRE